MSESAPDRHRTIVLRMFATRKKPRCSAKELGDRLAKKNGPALDPESADQTLTALIDDGLLAVTGGGKEGPHPRPRGSYRLTDKGKGRAKEEARPPKPEHLSDQTLAYQSAFLLLQLFRAEGHALSRSKLNEKLKSAPARQDLEFAKEATDHRLFELVEKGDIQEKRSGNSVGYTLTNSGLDTLAEAKQHTQAKFILTGEALNKLLGLVRESRAYPADNEETKTGSGPEGDPEPPVHPQPTLDEEVVLELVEQLKSGEYAENGLIPIHELRRLVGQAHGPAASDHSAFDPLIKRMRSQGKLRLMAISDLRDATQEELDDAIPGMNETLFYLDVE